jgi:GNAT superfamily N-acetyltransferase
VARKTVRLTVDHLAEVADPCCSCLFWELDPVTRGRVAPEEAAGEKETWLSAVMREWGSCGRVALVDDRVVGHAIYAPAAFFPGAAALPTAPVSPDAVLLSTIHVVPEARGGGIARLLVQGMARDLVTRGCGAVEAFGDSLGTRPCLVPTELLSRVGFKTQRAHPTSPRMRMELRSAVSWKDEVEQALDRLRGLVRPAPDPARRPAHRSLR